MNNKQSPNRSRQHQDSYWMIKKVSIGMYIILILYVLGLINPIIEGVNFVYQNIKLLF
jgi:hypothetical protein